MNTETQHKATKHAARHIGADGPVTLSGVACYIRQQTPGANRDNCDRLAAEAVSNLIGMRLIEQDGDTYDTV